MKTHISNKSADLFRNCFGSVFGKHLDVAVQLSQHPTNRLSDFSINLSEVPEVLSKTKTNSLSSNPSPNFLLNLFNFLL